MSTELLDTLYSCIGEIGREKIQKDLTSDITASTKYCNDIITKCKSRLGNDVNDELLGTLCEATLHFMLTVTLLPSERKVNVNGTDLDIVIPSVRFLKKQPEKTLIIQLVKKSNDIAKIKEIELIQPHRNNIWVISTKPVNIDHKNYHLDSVDSSYAKIILDINAFLVDRGVKGLKLLHGQ